MLALYATCMFRWIFTAGNFSNVVAVLFFTYCCMVNVFSVYNACGGLSLQARRRRGVDVRFFARL